MTLILAKEQEDAVDIINRKFKNKDLITVVSGYAGTGKSTIIKYFIEGMNLDNKVVYVTYTGKAALVLRKKGLPALTIHRLIYNAYKNSRTGDFYFVKKGPDELDEYSLIVVDEVSMVPMALMKDLLSYNIPIVSLGDPGQLPPIGEDNLLLSKPDVFLENIHRQAEGNPIIRISMLARQGKDIPLMYDDPFVKVITREDLTMGMLTWADQIICSKNSTRQSINKTVRESKGFEGVFPQAGDKIICLKNYWDRINDEDYPLTNGTIGIASNVSIGKNRGVLGQDLMLDFQADYTEPLFEELKVDGNLFKGMAPPITQSKRGKNVPMIHSFDFGYAITTHKAQGSSSKNILLYEETLRRDIHPKLLYTGITRAEEKLVLVKEPK